MWNKNCVFALLILNAYVYLTAFEIAINRLDVTYHDKNYLRNVNITVRRLNRKSPYLIFWKYYVVHPMGNNVTISGQILENLSGIYKPIPFNFYMIKWKLCEFYENEPFLGQTIARQFKKINNYSCPFPTGTVDYPGIQLRFDKFPYFSLMSSLHIKTVNIRFDMTYLTHTEEKIFSLKAYAKITQEANMKKNKATAHRKAGITF